MLKKNFFALLLIALFACTNCTHNIKLTDKHMEAGVSKELADYRKASIKDVEYNLFFSIPGQKSMPVTGTSQIDITISYPQPVVLDFRAEAQQIDSVKINGTPAEYIFNNEHIIIPQHNTVKGRNSIKIYFTAADQSLNRRENYLYTLLVPDRARTLFPCIDQPNMKAIYNLSLEVPEKWQAVANGAIATTEIEENRCLITFNPTEPLSTYLFSFVAGELDKEKFSRNGRDIFIYHRETDNKKKAQCSQIAKEVFDALEWLEDYTAIPYPFAKYDLIILPGFQYGGMEHTGATLYNDKRMFLSEHPTINEQLGRSSLIAHETAHMWFGDYVTMAWFDDVWTKEVFANYFASKMVEPQFPEINHRLNFITDYLPSAYSEDRTAGANPIKQHLDNLNNAGLVYGNIIYDKSPVVMEMLVQKIGEENFKKGIREYLQKYAYNNATWEDLISILDKYSADDLKSWSHSWVNEPGMPEIAVNSVDCSNIPNADGRLYGYFKLNNSCREELWKILDNAVAEENYLNMPDNELQVLKGSLLITLYENLRRDNLSATEYRDNMLPYLSKEKNPLLFSLALGYIGDCERFYISQNNHTTNTPDSLYQTERALWDIVTSNPHQSFRQQALRQYRSIARSHESIQRLYKIWQTRQAPKGCPLNESDYINLSYMLAIHLPDKAEEIANEQFKRISNPDRIAEYRFISPSVSPEKSVRDSVFFSLLEPENRRIEPWASAALGYLNHPVREGESLEYIRPALEEMMEIQRTGDIFFPRAWARALLSGHNSKEAAQIVEEFFAAHQDYPIMLGRKIKQQSYHLKR